MRGPDGVEWVSVREASKRLGVKESRVYQWVQRGRVASHKVGARRWVSWQDCAAQEAQGRPLRAG